MKTMISTLNDEKNESLHPQPFIAANGIEIKDSEEVVIPMLITFDEGLNVTVTKIENPESIPTEPLP